MWVCAYYSTHVYVGEQFASSFFSLRHVGPELNSGQRVYMTSISTLCATSPVQKKSAEGHGEDLSKSLMVLSQEVWTRVFPTHRPSASGILSLAHC